jgi:hypothetical protein
VSDEAFRLLDVRPAELGHAQYCPRCHESVVEPALQRYDEQLSRARNVGYWARTYRGHVPVLKKGQRSIEVAGFRDRDEALLKMAFLAVEQGFNGLVHGELISRKERNHGYQKMLWSGRATPARIDEEALERAEYHEATWRVIHHR